MRVIVRTPAELVAEYDLPDLDDSASDAEVLAAAAGAEPVQRGGPEIVGEPYVLPVPGTITLTVEVSG